MTNTEQTRLDQYFKDIDRAWLGVDLSKHRKLPNPLKVLDKEKPPGYYIVKLMRDPWYLGFACKILLGIDILPEQGVVLYKMWTRPFPMFIASRGFGKSWLMAVYCMLRMILTPGATTGGAACKIVIVGAAFRQSKVIFEYMETLWNNGDVYRDLSDSDSGPRRDTDRCTLKVNENWTIAVPLGDGTKIRGLRATIIIADEFGCLDKNTLVETSNGLIRIGDHQDTNISLCTGDISHPYEQPSDYIKTPLTDVYEVKLQNGYVIRCSNIHQVMTQDGWKNPLDLTSNDFVESQNIYDFPSDATIDEKTAWLLGILVSEGSVNHKSRISITTTDKNLADFIVNEYDFKLTTRKAYIDKRGWNCKQRYDLYKYDKVLRDKLYTLGLKYVTAHDKQVPNEILKQPKHVVMAFLEGLFEGDGSAFLFSDKWCQNRLGVAYYSASETLCRDVHILLDKLGYDGYINHRESSLSNNLQWFVRLNGRDAYNFANQLNIQRFSYPLQNCFVPNKPSHITWDKDRKKWKIGFKRLGKTIQKRFGNKRHAQNYVKQLQQLPRYRQVVSVTKLKEQQHLYDYYLPITHSFYAGGSRQHNSIPPAIYETVVQGFAAVAANPMDNVKAFARREARKEEGTWGDRYETAFQAQTGNQIIISGTADYDFKHYAEYWRKYCAFIRAFNNRIALHEQGFTEEDMGENFSSEDYTVIRIPYKLIPKGFMDDKVVSRAKATVHSGIYQMEYGACECKDTSIITHRGLIPIQHVQIGDLVLTHKGRFRPVTNIYYRKYIGEIYRYNTYGYSLDTRVTKDHQFWYGHCQDEQDYFNPLYKNAYTCLANLNELENIDELDVETICTSYLETKDKKYIYPQSSQSKIDITQQREIRNSTETQVALSKKFGIRQTAISYICNDNRKPKASIPKMLPLDYYMGLIIGYYAAEGSTGANGKQTSFALDEHKDTEYQQQLLNALDKVFGFKGKRYVKKKNTVEICVNSRLVAEVMKYICPGLSHDKLIKHEVMFANEECLRGIIEGYWNGDGHIPKGRGCLDAHCININLLNQIRMGLSYFEIASSLLYKADNTFSLTMSGDNQTRFLNTFYNTEVSDKHTKGHIRNDGNKSIFDLSQKREIEYYDGFVYSLRVDEDYSYSTPNATTHNCFTSDSDGFFKRSLIEACVASEKNINSGRFPVWCPAPFEAVTRGRQTSSFVIGIDPASEADNFSIVVIEIFPEHQRVVYCWTTNRDDFKKRKRAGLTESADFYGFCARKIRDLLTIFPPAIGHPKGAAIGMDSQGGGIAVIEALHDPDKMKPGEVPIWPIIDPDKEADTDDLPGLHIVDMVQFARAEWTGKANHGMRKDLEDKVLLFPQFDPITLELSVIEDAERANEFRRKHNKELTIYDSLEDAVLEIEELKNELTTIVMTRTGLGAQGRDRWDTPEIKTQSGKKGYLRKDRYSSIIIANMIAREIQRKLPEIEYEAIGGFVGTIAPPKEGERLYNGPEWFTKGTEGFGGFSV